ncbi:MAG: Bug family tripartite tricarboxylate transporter substrate binding protein [Burkholderiales bacterium]
MYRHTRLCCAAALAATVLIALPTEAAYPDRPIKLIVPAVPGTAPDVLSRLISDRLGNALGQPVVVENRPGAIGTIGLSAVAKSAPNGYTLGVLNVPYIVAPNLLAQMPFDIERDLQPVSLMAWNYGVLVVPAASPVHSMADLVSIAKHKPGDLKFSSPGNATPPHLAVEFFKRAAGIDLTHIPYKGAAAAVAALLAGDVDIYFASPGVIAQLVKAGKLRTLATAAPRRLIGHPELPTFAELGYAVEVSDWQGLVAPAGTPVEVIARLHAEITKILADPDMRARLQVLGMEPGDLGPQQFAPHVQSELTRWGKLVREAGIKAD